VYWATRLRGVHVHAYEPHPETCAMLALNIEKNRLSQRVTAYREAVGRSNGTEVLRNSPASVNNTAYGAGWAGDAHEQFTGRQFRSTKL
jgi:FkbM family methyltransferase